MRASKLVSAAVFMVAVFSLSFGYAFAGPPEHANGKAGKEDVCHYDADSDTFHLITVSQNALRAHLDHGDIQPAEQVPGNYLGVDCSVVGYVSGETIATTTWGDVDLDFEVWGTPSGTVSWERENTWSGEVVAATIPSAVGDAEFTVRVTEATVVEVIKGCDIGIRVWEGGPGVGQWQIISVTQTVGSSYTCGAIGQVQGPWTIDDGDIVVLP